jgi:hypothetical protein
MSRVIIEMTHAQQAFSASAMCGQDKPADSYQLGLLTTDGEIKTLEGARTFTFVSIHEVEDIQFASINSV